MAWQKQTDNLHFHHPNAETNKALRGCIHNEFGFTLHFGGGGEMRIRREAGWKPSIHFQGLPAPFLSPTGPKKLQSPGETASGCLYQGESSPPVTSQTGLAAFTIPVPNK